MVTGFSSGSGCYVKPRSLRLPVTNENGTATKYDTGRNVTHIKLRKIWKERIAKLSFRLHTFTATSPSRYKVCTKCNNRNFRNKIGKGNSEYQFTPKICCFFTSLRHITRGHITRGHTTRGHITRGHTTRGHITRGHITRGHTTRGHITRGHTTRGHITRGHITRGHTTRGHTTRGHITRGHTTRGHITRGHTTRGHTTRGHTTRGHTTRGHITRYCHSWAG